MERKQFTPKDVACPKCGSGQGEMCRSPMTNSSQSTYHTARREMFRELLRQRGLLDEDV